MQDLISEPSNIAGVSSTGTWWWWWWGCCLTTVGHKSHVDVLCKIANMGRVAEVETTRALVETESQHFLRPSEPSFCFHDGQDFSN